MHSLTIVFGPAGTCWRLLFKTKENADTAYGIIDRAMNQATAPLRTEDPRAQIEDDFGQKALLSVEAIHGLMLEDLDQTKLAAIEMSVHNGRAQADAEQAMRADPKIMSSIRSRQQGGPPILAPMGNGFTR